MKQLDVAAYAYIDGGLSIIPINRKKRPAAWLLPQAATPDGKLLYWKELDNGAWCETTEDTGKPKGTWEPYQVVGPTKGEIDRWLRANVPALAVVCGAVSGGVEILDFDNRNGETWYAAWAASAGDPVTALGLPLQRTGGLGYQVGWRCSEIAGNQKLAWAADDTEASGRKVMIETRGEGGYALLPPSPHPSGRNYTILQNRFSRIPTITPECRRALLDAARQLNQVQLPSRATPTATYSDGPNEVVDAYNQHHSIEETLLRYGYTHVSGNRWSRPGKSDSAGVQILRDGRAYAYSSNDLLAGDRMGDSRPFSAFDLFAYYDHNEDYKSATRSAAVALGIASTNLHTLIYVEGYDNAKAVRETMFSNGWVARGFRPDKINLDGVDKYQRVIVWAYGDHTALRIASQIPGAYPLVVPGDLDAVAMLRDGILQPYLEAVLADTASERRP